MNNKHWDYHIHTTFSDGNNTAHEMARKAVELGLDGICFCDHCRASSDWLDLYADEVRRIGEAEPRLDVLCAVEAKIVDHRGTLDVPKELPDGIIQVAAIHRIPDGQGGFIRASETDNCREYALDCWKKAVEGLALNGSVSRLAHPFSLLGKLNITVEDTEFWEWLDSIFSHAGYLLENNVKYDSSMVPEWFTARCKDRMLPASDSHSVTELAEMYKRLYLTQR